MKSQVLHTVWCNIYADAAGEIRYWSLTVCFVLRFRRMNLAAGLEAAGSAASSSRDIPIAIAVASVDLHSHQEREAFQKT